MRRAGMIAFDTLYFVVLFDLAIASFFLFWFFLNVYAVAAFVPVLLHQVFPRTFAIEFFPIVPPSVFLVSSFPFPSILLEEGETRDCVFRFGF